MLTTLVISCCLVFIFLQLTNPYISLAKNAIKHTTTETYLISYRLANIHNIIKTISLAAYANAKYGLLLKVRYTARKLVVTDIVLGMMLAVVNYSPPSRCTRLEEGASIRRSLVSRLRGVKFTGRFLTVQTLQTILCSELTPASQPVLCKVILYSQYILSECCV